MHYVAEGGPSKISRCESTISKHDALMFFAILRYSSPDEHTIHNYRPVLNFLEELDLYQLLSDHFMLIIRVTASDNSVLQANCGIPYQKVSHFGRYFHTPSFRTIRHPCTYLEDLKGKRAPAS